MARFQSWRYQKRFCRALQSASPTGHGARKNPPPLLPARNTYRTQEPLQPRGHQRLPRAHAGQFGQLVYKNVSTTAADSFGSQRLSPIAERFVRVYAGLNKTSYLCHNRRCPLVPARPSTVH